jgi:hypothetical protein
LLTDPAADRLAKGVGVALAGWAVAALGLGSPSGHPIFLYGVTALLCVGLYGSVHGIDKESASGDVRTVVLAVTVGVLLKTALIAGVMWLFFGHPAVILLALAVAQIDPLSVGALIGRARMSPRAKSLLLAWASFDDPITALLTVYLSSLVLGTTGGGYAGYLTNLGLNLVFAGAVLAAVLLTRRWGAGHRVRPGMVRTGSLLLLIALLAVATAQFLVLGMALIGLFFRPELGRLLDGALTGAFYLATFAMGTLLVAGIEPVMALVLGVAAFAAQAVVGGLLITRGLPVRDRVSLALGQQNGITAILLALALAPAYPQAVAVIAPAVLVVNVLHVAANTGWQRVLTGGLRRPLRSAPDAPARPAPGSVRPAVADAQDPVGEPPR